MSTRFPTLASTAIAILMLAATAASPSPITNVSRTGPLFLVLSASGSLSGIRADRAIDQDASAGKVISIAVIGATNLTPVFIDELKTAAARGGLRIEVVPRTDDKREYTVAIAQETTLDSATAAVVLLDRSSDVPMSVVRAGRLSGRRALNACAKELVKNLQTLSR